MNGTPVAADASAAWTSPCWSGVTRPSTPTGAIISGEVSVVPNSSTEVSRSAVARSIRGTSAHWSKAATLARWVDSVPLPPAM